MKHKKTLEIASILFCKLILGTFFILPIKASADVYQCRVFYGMKSDQFLACKDKQVLKLIQNGRAKDNIIDLRKLLEVKRSSGNNRISKDLLQRRYKSTYFDITTEKNSINTSAVYYIDHELSAFAYVLYAVKMRNTPALIELIDHYKSDYLKYVALRFSFLISEEVEILKSIGEDILLEASLYDDYFFSIIENYQYSEDALERFLVKLEDFASHKKNSQNYGSIESKLFDDQFVFEKVQKLIKVGLPANRVMKVMTNSYKFKVSLSKERLKFLYDHGYSLSETFVLKKNTSISPLSFLLRNSRQSYLEEYVFELSSYLKSVDRETRDSFYKDILKNENIKNYKNLMIKNNYFFSDGTNIVDYAWKNRLYYAFFKLLDEFTYSKSINPREVSKEEIRPLIKSLIKVSRYIVNDPRYYSLTILIKNELDELENEYRKNFKKVFEYNKVELSYLSKVHEILAKYKDIRRDHFRETIEFISKNKKKIKINNKLKLSYNVEALDIVSSRTQRYEYILNNVQKDSKSSFSLICMDDRLRPLDVYDATLVMDKESKNGKVYYKSLVNHLSAEICTYYYRPSDLNHIERISKMSFFESENDVQPKKGSSVPIYEKGKYYIGFKDFGEGKGVLTTKVDNELFNAVTINCHSSGLDRGLLRCDHRVSIISYGDINNDGVNDFVIRLTSENSRSTSFFSTVVFISNKRGHDNIMLH